MPTHVENNQAAEDTGEISINFAEIFQALKKYRISIALISFLFAGIGAFYSLTLNNEYLTEVKLLPEADSKMGGAAGGLGGLSSLAGLAGINIGGGGGGADALQPAMYPEIAQSIPFLQELAKAKIYNPKRKRFETFASFYALDNRNAPIQLFEEDKKSAIKDMEDINLPAGSIGQDMVNINKKDAATLSALKSSFTVEVDKKTFLIKIAATTVDPVVSASIANLVQNQLTKYVTRYRTEKVRTEMAFLADRQAEARKRYDQSLFTLSNYKDQNRNVFLNVAKDQGKKLQYEVDLAFNIYSSLTTQLSETKIKVQKETPIFKILEPAQIALRKTGPKRSLITLGALFLGLFVSLIYVFFKSVNLKELLS